MIKRIRIQRYKSLLDVDVTLKPLSVLIRAERSREEQFHRRFAVAVQDRGQP